MLRLWPEEIHIGLFEDHCWLRRGQDGAVRNYACGQGERGDAIVAMLRHMLADPDCRLRPGSRVVITVSDTLAALRLLPWQAALRQPDEIRRYAQVLFERDGRAMDDGMVMRAQFNRYGAAGLAFAFPRQWLSELVATVDQAGLQLTRVLPAAVCAYERPQLRPKSGEHVFVLQEQGRVSALVSSRGGLRNFDVEPITTDSADALLRLVRRTAGRCSAVESVVHWSSDPGRRFPESLYGSEFGKARSMALARESLC